MGISAKDRLWPTAAKSSVMSSHWSSKEFFWSRAMRMPGQFRCDWVVKLAEIPQLTLSIAISCLDCFTADAPDDNTIPAMTSSIRTESAAFLTREELS